MNAWARCLECGDGEVVFDAWVTYSGEVAGTFDESLCNDCGARNPKYIVEVGEVSA